MNALAKPAIGSGFRPTAEQDAVIQHIAQGDSSLDVDALAGAAKSTTLRMAAPQVRGKALAIAFNVSTKKALEQSMPEGIDVLTLNGLGHRAWQRMLGSTRLKLEENKMYRLIRAAMEENGLDYKDDADTKDLIQSCVNAARTHGLVPAGKYPGVPKSFIPDTEEGWLELSDTAELDLKRSDLPRIVPIVRSILKKSIEQAYAGVIDFSDQIYMSCCFNGAFPRYDAVLGDEIQDFSPLNHYMLRKVVTGRFYGVGDERQSIYAFRGADADSIPKLRSMFSTTTLPLSTTFRCAKRIVENVHWRAPHMRAAEWAPEGEIETWGEWTTDQIPVGAMVICRNNAPLISLAFKLLSQGTPITIIGGEFSKQLQGFIRRISGGDPEMKSSIFFALLDKWLGEELREAEDRRNPARAGRATDKAEAIHALPGKTVGDISAALERIFAAKNGIITLSSGHKSKGLEESTIVHLSPHLIPSRFAESDRAKLQEDNLKYVIDTRAKTKLIYANYDLVEG